MALQEWAASVNFTYSVVSINKNSPLGAGSYGAVYKAKCDELHCAAKVIHESLLINDPAGAQGERRVVDRFYQECHFLSELKHPNIVQYLGTHCEATEKVSVVLLMELMDESLTHHLKHAVSPLLFHVEIDFCYDVALALSYLHSNHIVHRDLTSNNVLLYAGKRAKVADFGVSKLITPEVLQRSSMSLRPGTAVYMPPEALEEMHTPHYTEKLDCFSYGVLCIQIFTRTFPSPMPRYRIIHSQDSNQRIRAVVSESVRRQDHIGMVKSDHVFLPTALECLSDNESGRPSSQELCHRLALLKEEEQYTNSGSEQDSSCDVVSQSHETERNTIQQLERELERSQTQCQYLQQQLDSLRSEHRREITSKNTEIQEQRIRVATFEQQRRQWEQEYQELESSLEALRDENSRLYQDLSLKDRLLEERKENVTSVKFEWREGSNACVCLRREPDAVVDGDMIYFKYFWGISIFAYNRIHSSWVELPNCPVSSFSMAVLNNLLSIIGGKTTDLVPVSKLFTYCDKKWMSDFPNMQIERYWTISKTWESFLIVMGGEGKGRRVLNTVEVLDVNTGQWSFATSLLRPIDSATAAICGDHLYIGGGSHPETARYVAVCSLPRLLQDVKEGLPKNGGGFSQESIWNRVSMTSHTKKVLLYLLQRIYLLLEVKITLVSQRHLFTSSMLSVEDGSGTILMLCCLLLQ